MRVNSFLLFSLLFVIGCNPNQEKKTKTNDQEEARNIRVPAFNADSAYYFVKRQVDFGPRIPNTRAHRETSNFLAETLKRLGARVTIQEFQAKNYEGQSLDLKNIIASFDPGKTKRILLAAHWDTRPFSDKDTEKPMATFQGANDGASGVGVLLEIARDIHGGPSPETGIDIILFDGEDGGEREGEQGTHPLPEGLQDWWCLGSQYWSKHKHQPNYSAYYGILLDMVGARSAQFHQEGYSMEFAPSIVEKVWNHAARLGYSYAFVKKKQAGITDDHVFVNTIAKIPMIDLVHFEPGIGYFGDFHHTQKDNLDLINRDMLGIVGTTVLNVIYYEK